DQRTELRCGCPGDVGGIRAEAGRFRKTAQGEFDVELLIARRGHGDAKRRRWRQQARGASSAGDVRRRQQLDAVQIVVAAAGGRAFGAGFGAWLLHRSAAVAGPGHDQQRYDKARTRKREKPDPSSLLRGFVFSWFRDHSLQLNPTLMIAKNNASFG